MTTTIPTSTSTTIPAPVSRPADATPSPRRSAAWRTWDWVNLALGVFLILAPLIIPGAPTVRFLVLGVVVSAIALWGLATASSYPAEIAMSVAAFATYFAGHFGLFGAAPRWTLWLTGLAIFIVAMYTLKERQVRS